MTYLITYQSRHDTRIIEWVAPEGWSAATISRHFEQQFQGTEIISIEAQAQA